MEEEGDIAPLDLEASLEELFSDSASFISDASGDEMSPISDHEMSDDGSSLPASRRPSRPPSRGASADAAPNDADECGVGARRLRGSPLLSLDVVRSRPMSLEISHNLAEDGFEGEGPVPIELTGEVRLTSEGAVPITPAEEKPARTLLLPTFAAGDRSAPAVEEARERAAGGDAADPLWDPQCDDDDWLALHKPDARPECALETMDAEEQHVLLPLLTPSNTKLCGALVDAFLPLRTSRWQ